MLAAISSMQRWRASRAAQAICGVSRRFGMAGSSNGSPGDRRFLGQHIDPGAAQPAGFECQPKRMAIDQRAARGIDQQCIGFHERKLARTDQIARRVMRGSAEKGCPRRRAAAQFDAPDPGRAGSAGSAAVGDDDAHAEGLGHPRRHARDRPNRPRRTRGPAVRGGTCKNRGIIARPGSVPDEARIIVHMLSEAQYQTPHLLHHRGGTVGAYVAHGDAAFARRVQIDVVRAGGGKCDQFQGGAPQLFARQACAVQRHDLGAANAIATSAPVHVDRVRSPAARAARLSPDRRRKRCRSPGIRPA